MRSGSKKHGVKPEGMGLREGAEAGGRTSTAMKPRGGSAVSAADWFRAKLEYDEAPYVLHHQMEQDKEAVCVLDVRPADAYQEAHIPGARSVPLEELTSKLGELPRDKTIVTYCGSITCPLSTRAALQLAEKGFRVKHLHGGIAEWSRMGFPVEGRPGVGP